MKAPTRTPCSAFPAARRFSRSRVLDAVSPSNSIPTWQPMDPRKRMQAINEAWQTLSDQHRRARGGLAMAVWEWPPSGQPDWHGARAATVPRRSDEPSSGRTGWIVLAGMMLLMISILVAGLVAAADGPEQPAPWAPGQYNLDTP